MNKFTSTIPTRALQQVLRPSIPSSPILARPFSSSSSSFATPSTSATPLEADASARPKYFLPKGQVFNGTVTSTGKMAQTTTVQVERRMTHHKTLKEYKQHTKYLIHDPKEECVVGDIVQLRNCRPVSKRKRFELVKIIKGARERAENMAQAQKKME